MDPDAALQELREWYNAMQDDPDGISEDMVEVLTLFDNLDNWIVSGGFLPAEWNR